MSRDQPSAADVASLAGYLLYDDGDRWTYRFPNGYEVGVYIDYSGERRGLPLRFEVDGAGLDRVTRLTEAETVARLVEIRDLPAPRRPRRH